jgi:N-acetylneuraminate lyase
MAKPLAGMYAALLSGFADDGGFCPERQAAIMSHVGRQGLDGLYIGGSSAESGLMSTEELLDQQRAIAGLRAPEHGRIIAHVGQPSTAASVALARQAAALGFDGVSALPPHAYPFSDEEILAYYAEVAAASDLPMIVYEIPLRTGRALPLPLLERIVACPMSSGSSSPRPICSSSRSCAGRIRTSPSFSASTKCIMRPARRAAMAGSARPTTCSASSTPP